FTASHVTAIFNHPDHGPHVLCAVVFCLNFSRQVGLPYCRLGALTVVQRPHLRNVSIALNGAWIEIDGLSLDIIDHSDPLCVGGHSTECQDCEEEQSCHLRLGLGRSCSLAIEGYRTLTSGCTNSSCR